MSKRTDSLKDTERYLHVFNRGVNHEQIFFSNSDYALFLSYVHEFLTNTDLHLYLYALLPNHFHLALRQESPYSVSRFMKNLCQLYAQHLNQKRTRSGHVFRGKYGITEGENLQGLLRLSYYVHMNPVLAGLVTTPEAWAFSSCRQYLAPSRTSVIDADPLLSLVGGTKKYRQFLEGYDPSDPNSVSKFIEKPNVRSHI